jgi:hypothetical protein
MKRVPGRSRDSKRKDFGDFQTPPELVSEVLDAIDRSGGGFSRVLEPTCGQGRFVEGLLARANPPREIRGIELQPEHADRARARIDPKARTIVAIETADVFKVDLRQELEWSETGPLLVVGNLPWVTTAALGASGATNGPERSNFLGRPGLEAMTGSSNFDIAEAIWLKLIRELSAESPTIALLCKTAVARSVLRAISTSDLPITHATLWRIDAMRWFRAAVDACLLRVEIGPGPRAVEAKVFGDLTAQEPESTLGFQGGQLISSLADYQAVAFADGPSPLNWRQGVKHDASLVMELTRHDDGEWRNKLGEIVDVEAEFVFPLLKGTDLAGGRTGRPARSVLVTQRRLGDETGSIEFSAPRLWAYLNRHQAIFQRRKSSIYRGRSPFAMFGVGDYSFAPFKVAVSGFHKSPHFGAIGPVQGVPTMVDDTCYFLPCRTLEQARLLEQTLNGPASLRLIHALSFSDAKRPLTKSLLQRLDLKALVSHAGLSEHWNSDWETDWKSPSRQAASV